MSVLNWLKRVCVSKAPPPPPPREHSASQQFFRLNAAWNADPNVPEPRIERAGDDILLQFAVRDAALSVSRENDLGMLRFLNCGRYRLGKTNDEGWYRGQCRYSSIAPAWGEFYEITGDDPLRDQPDDWVICDGSPQGARHFLFYFRDETFECFARDWLIEPVDRNALYRSIGVQKPV